MRECAIFKFKSLNLISAVRVLSYQSDRVALAADEKNHIVAVSCYLDILCGYALTEYYSVSL